MTTSESASTPTAPTPDRSKGIVIGRIAGAPVIITRSWFLAAVVLTILFVPTVRAIAPHLDTGAYLVAFAFVLLLFASVFLHEISHALVARARGQRVTELAITIWGGHTAYTGGLGRPLDGFLVAVVGPLTNLALAVGFWIAYVASPVQNVPTLLLYAAAVSNAFVGVFNLLPGLPLDGGQILESLVWALTGKRTTGTVAAGWVGRVVAVGVLLWALLLPFLQGTTPRLTAVLWSALISAFLWAGAGAAITNARRRESIAALSVITLARPALLVSQGTTVAEALSTRRNASTVDASSPDHVVVVGSDQSPLAILDEDAVAAVPTMARSTTDVDAVAVPFVPGSAVYPGMSGAELLNHLATAGGGAQVVPVIDSGRVTGVLYLADVARAVRNRA